MKNLKRSRVLVISANLEIGGIERSLLGLLEAFDYSLCEVDLLLWRHQGAFLTQLPVGPRLLPEERIYATFQRPIAEIAREGHRRIALARTCARLSTDLLAFVHRLAEPGYLAAQRSWRYALPELPKIAGEYDLVLSFMGPHYLATDRSRGRVKIGWIHTDYSVIPHDGAHELAMWTKLDYIAAVSEECRSSFIERFPLLSGKTIVIENVLSTNFVHRQAMEFSADAEMPIEAGTLRILTVGRFCHQKALDQAVLACRTLIDSGCCVCWYAIGYGPDEHIIRKMIEENGLTDHFIILGKKLNPYPYMRACDIYVQPSRYEGKAVTVREAQILGKPVVITRYPTSASQVEEGVDGHVCELGVEGIAAGIRRLVDDVPYRDRLAAASARRDYSNRGELEKIYALMPQRGPSE